MRISRRTLVRCAALGAAAAATAGVGLAGLRRVWPGFRRAASPPLPEAPAGPLEEETAGTLLAATAALLGSRPSPPGPEGHRELRAYLRQFESRATDLAGYRETYRRFARAADEMAAARGEASFATAGATVRHRILEELCPPGILARLRLGLSDPDRVRFRLYVVREILARYAAEAAWRDLGYGEPPGVPRGLDAYTERPPALDGDRSGP